MKNATTTSEAMSVTDEQIEALRREAAAAGDARQQAVCLVALGYDDDECVQEQRRWLESIGVIPEHVDADVRARAECAARTPGRGW